MTTDALLRRNRELSILNAIAEGLNRAVDLHTTRESAGEVRTCIYAEGQCHQVGTT